MAHVRVFEECPGSVPPAYRDLFVEYGTFAWTIIASIEAAEQTIEEEETWDRLSPVRGEADEEDQEIDFGPEEPDSYGEDEPYASHGT